MTPQEAGGMYSLRKFAVAAGDATGDGVVTLSWEVSSDSTHGVGCAAPAVVATPRFTG